MADTTARTLRLLTLLQRRRHWTGSDLAARLETSDRTLRRDIGRLRVLGYTIDSGRGVAGGYSLRGSSGNVALLLDDDEATALAAALHTAAAGNSELAEASLGALTKVLSMLGPVQRHRAETVRTATAFGSADSGVSPQLSILDAVASSCRDEVRLSFDYMAADSAQTSRYVEPCQLVALNSRWYLVAFDCDREAWRTFRVDRMCSVTPARNCFTPRPAPASDLYEYVRFNVRQARTTLQVTVDIDVPGDDVREDYGTWVSVEDLTSERCRVVMDADSFRWPSHIVATIDAPFVVVSPPAFRQHLLALAERIQASV